MSCSSLHDGDDDPRAGDHRRLDALEQSPDQAGPGVAEVAELLGQAGVHVVQVGHAQPLRQPQAEHSGFLVGVDRVVPAGARQPRRGDGQQQVEQDLDRRRADADAAHERRPGAAEDLEARDPHVPAERVGHQIHPVAELAERPDAVVLAERGSARLEERLRGKHQDPRRGLRISFGGHGWGRDDFTLRADIHRNPPASMRVERRWSECITGASGGLPVLAGLESCPSAVSCRVAV